MDYFAEAQIARELMKFAANGTLYRGSKPVMWSVVEKTALAEAEVEYADHTSTTIWVRFPVLAAGIFQGASVVIWTTTPWTMPGNRALAGLSARRGGYAASRGTRASRHAARRPDLRASAARPGV
jgi:isoleucyl-tRNA synthetase